MSEETEGTQKVPVSVRRAIAAFDEAERAQMFADRKNHLHRNAALVMALDPAAESWKKFYDEETGKILDLYEERRRREGPDAT